jgi:tetratricopeptide (TPR) repeat protein
MNPSYARARALLANVALRLGRFDAARTQFTALLGLGYQPARSHFGLGRVAESTGDLATALKEYRLALKLESALAPAREALIRLEKQQ